MISYVYIVVDNENKIHGVFKRRDNAINSMPENKKNFPRQLSGNSWAFGQDSKFYWHLHEANIRDSNDLI
jgi:hypothetical protein